VDLPERSGVTYRARGTVSLVATGTLSNTATLTAPPDSSTYSATDVDVIEAVE